MGTTSITIIVTWAGLIFFVSAFGYVGYSNSIGPLLEEKYLVNILQIVLLGSQFFDILYVLTIQLHLVPFWRIIGKLEARSKNFLRVTFIVFFQKSFLFKIFIFNFFFKSFQCKSDFHHLHQTWCFHVRSREGLNVPWRTIYQNLYLTKAREVDQFDFWFVRQFSVKTHTMYVSMGDVLKLCVNLRFCVIFVWQSCLYWIEN